MQLKVQLLRYSLQIRPIDYFFVPPAYQPPPNGQGPIANLIHRLGYKISNTADFLAEMLRGTVKVISSFNKVS